MNKNMEIKNRCWPRKNVENEFYFTCENISLLCVRERSEMILLQGLTLFERFVTQGPTAAVAAAEELLRLF